MHEAVGLCSLEVFRPYRQREWKEASLILCMDVRLSVMTGSVRIFTYHPLLGVEVMLVHSPDYQVNSLGLAE